MQPLFLLYSEEPSPSIFSSLRICDPVPRELTGSSQAAACIFQADGAVWEMCVRCFTGQRPVVMADVTKVTQNVEF